MRVSISRPVLPLLLDLDGTLIDSEQLHYESTRIVLAANGAHLDAAAFERFLGWSELETWSELSRLLNLRFDAEHLVERRTEVFLELAAKRGVRVMPGMRELLSWARRQQGTLAVVSSLPRQQIVAALAAADLGADFDAIVSGHDDVAKGKPAPDAYVAAAAAIEAAPSDCLAFEDSAVGMRSARDAGCRVVGVHAGAHPRHAALVDVQCADGHAARAWLALHCTC
jgi:HAD superfamily hydrolase (TIGR01509 family)